MFLSSPQDIRKSISANVHVKAILCKLMQGASELAGGVEEEGGPPSRSIHLHTVEAIHKVILKLEVTVKVSRTSRISFPPPPCFGSACLPSLPPSLKPRTADPILIVLHTNPRMYCMRCMCCAACAGRAREIGGGGEGRPTRRRGKLNLSRTSGSVGDLPERNVTGTRHES